MSARVAGYCPACGGASLFLGAGDYVTCSRSDCPNPTAVADLLLEDARETEHIVRIGWDSFDVQHPLRERLHADMFGCGLHRYLTELAGPPRHAGLYRVTWRGEDQAQHWEEIP